MSHADGASSSRRPSTAVWNESPDFVSRYAAFLGGWGKWAVLGFWGVVAVFGAVFALQLLQNTTMTFVAPPNTLAAKARAQMNLRFPESASAAIVVVMATTQDKTVNTMEVRPCVHHSVVDVEGRRVCAGPPCSAPGLRCRFAALAGVSL